MDSEMSNYPNLARYFKHFKENGGRSEEPECLPYLVIWIRLLVENVEEEGKWVDVPSFFGFDEVDTEEFNSWGRNSRWKNVFMPFATHFIDRIEEKCLELAKDRGDPNVEDWLREVEA